MSWKPELDEAKFAELQSRQVLSGVVQTVIAVAANDSLDAGDNAAIALELDRAIDNAVKATRRAGSVLRYHSQTEAARSLKPKMPAAL